MLALQHIAGRKARPVAELGLCIDSGLGEDGLDIFNGLDPVGVLAVGCDRDRQRSTVLVQNPIAIAVGPAKLGKFGLGTLDIESRLPDIGGIGPWFGSP